MKRLSGLLKNCMEPNREDMKTRIETEVLTDEQGTPIGGGLVRMKLFQVMEGKELTDYLTSGVNVCINELKKRMSGYNRKPLFDTWFQFVRQIEEYINIWYEYGAPYEDVSRHIHLDRKCEVEEIDSVVAETFGSDVAVRFLELVDLFIGYASIDFDGKRIKEWPVETLYDLLLFLQARRLHIMTILNLIPIWAQGDIKFSREDIPNKMNEWIGILMSITTGCQSITEANCLPSFYGKLSPSGKMEFSHQYTHLEKNFLEPQPLTPVELEVYRSERLGKRETKKERSICSKEELELTMRNEIAYNERYGITEKESYKELMTFMDEMKMYFKDDYAIEVPQNEFDRLCRVYDNLELYKELEEFDDIENSRFGFVKMEGVYYSTYFMLIRYYTNIVMKMLRRRRRFQIDAGFVFEEQVRSVLGKYGFEVQEDCKRIERKEFDVVCVKDGTIYNFQCKNNYINISTIGLKETTATCKRNKQLISYYKAALHKEEGREYLLKGKLGIDNVKHFVISRYPVVSDSERIIPFNRLDEWCETSVRDGHGRE